MKLVVNCQQLDIIADIIVLDIQTVIVENGEIIL